MNNLFDSVSKINQFEINYLTACSSTAVIFNGGVGGGDIAMVCSAQCIYALEVIHSKNLSLLLRFTLFGSGSGFILL